MMRSMSSSVNLVATSALLTTVDDLIPILLPFLAPGEGTIANGTRFGG